jgi:CRP-like cAMP-binding protein
MVSPRATAAYDCDHMKKIFSRPDLAALPARLRSQAVQVAAAAGETVFRRGARPARMFFVLEGEVRLVRSSAGGAEIVLQRASSGFLAEASLESARYHCDAVAAADSRLAAFPIGPFRDALRRDEAFRTFWITRLAREVRALRSQNERLALRSAAERIEHYIEAEGERGRLELPRTRKAWAAELGLTHEALYRTLASLQRSGRLSAAQSGGALVLTLNPRRRP